MLRTSLSHFQNLSEATCAITWIGLYYLFEGCRHPGRTIRQWILSNFVEIRVTYPLMDPLVLESDRIRYRIHSPGYAWFESGYIDRYPGDFKSANKICFNIDATVWQLSTTMNAWFWTKLLAYIKKFTIYVIINIYEKNYCKLQGWDKNLKTSGLFSNDVISLSQNF